jgi:hypothetical protein
MPTYTAMSSAASDVPADDRSGPRSGRSTRRHPDQDVSPGPRLRTVLNTNDRNTMVGFAHERIAAGTTMPGLIVTSNEQSIGMTIADILTCRVHVRRRIQKSRRFFLPLRG